MKPNYLIALFFLATATSAYAQDSYTQDFPVPIATDSRIKTFVYNENDVFSLMTHYGYQSNIEFGKGEEIETLSLGDRVGWQVIPAGRRLFIRPMMKNAHTNMTIITNKRSYQFDLRSSAAPSSADEELVYVVRFYYPDDRENRLAAASAHSSMMPPMAPMAAAPGLPMDAPSMPMESSPAYNYQYSYTGSESIAPTKLFDDGHYTFFKFTGEAPQVFVVSPEGTETQAEFQLSNGYVVVAGTAARFSLRQGSELVCVYNDRLAGRP